MPIRIGMAARVSATQSAQTTAVAGAGTTISTDVKGTVKAGYRVAAAIKASVFIRVSCEVQAWIMEKLIADKRIVVDGEDPEGEYDDVAKAAEEGFDSEVDLVDEDESGDDGDFLTPHAVPDGEASPQLGSRPRFYEIKVVQRRPGRWACVPPRNPLLGYRVNGFDEEAQRILDAARRQFAFYAAVAKWLQEENAALREQSAFQENHAPKTRIDFCKSDFCKDVGLKDDTPIHGYCEKCRLSWQSASLPLACVFTT